jgi:hypothetical protein
VERKENFFHGDPKSLDLNCLDNRTFAFDIAVGESKSGIDLQLWVTYLATTHDALFSRLIESCQHAAAEFTRRLVYATMSAVSVHTTSQIRHTAEETVYTTFKSLSLVFG